MGLKDLVDNSDRPLTDSQSEATDEIFPRFTPASDYRDQVVAEFLTLDSISPHLQTRDQPLPPEVDRARRAIRNVANKSNRTESNVEQRVKQIYDGSGEKGTEIARFADDLKAIEAHVRE